MSNQIESIESFVARLQEDGVEAGKVQAAQIIEDAERSAGELIRKAKQEAEQIRKVAQDEGKQILERGKVELEQAARDVVQRLRETVNEGLGRILQHGGQTALREGDFLKSVVSEVVLSYARQDSDNLTCEIKLSDEMLDSISQGVLADLSSQLNSTAELSFSGGLKSAGFEYSIEGASVEVTAESLAELLSEMVGPQVRAVIGGLK